MGTSDKMTERLAEISDMELVRHNRRKHHGFRRKECRNQTNYRLCRLEELEKRELLAADPLSIGVTYVEQITEAQGDLFSVAWVGGEASTTLDTVVINLDKNLNHQTDSGEAVFDIDGAQDSEYGGAAFRQVLVDGSDVGVTGYTLSEDRMSLTIHLNNFHSGDCFQFVIDVDEYQPNGSWSNTQIVEGKEFGGSLKKDDGTYWNDGQELLDSETSLNDVVAGSWVSMTFTSTHYETENVTGMFLEYFDREQTRPEALTEAFTSTELPYDVDDGLDGVFTAGLYDQVDLTLKPITISGYVYADYDVDCNYDLGEDDPLSGVTVTLFDSHGEQVGVTTTSRDGYYEFGVDLMLMPGEYTVECQTDVQSAEGLTYYDFCAKGGEFGQKIDPLHIDVSGMDGGDVAPNNNFSKVLPGSISGYVFEDRNDGNNKESGEPGIDGTTVQLWKLVDGDWKYIESTVTNADGYYRFEINGATINDIRKNVNGTYMVKEIQPAAYSDGEEYLGDTGGEVSGNDIFSNIVLHFGHHASNYNFGELKLGSIAGNVYEDRNDNGRLESGEPGIGNVQIDLFQWTGEAYEFVASTQTDPNGAYLFSNLPIGINYAVKEHQPSSYSDGKDQIGSLGGNMTDDYFSVISVNWDQHGVNYNFGELKLGSIEGNVFEDRNDNGAMETGEAGIANVQVDLYQWNNNDYVFVKSTTTDANGHYAFDDLEINQEYAVKEHQPSAYSDGEDHLGSLQGTLLGDYTTEINVQWDDHGTDYDFGELKRGSISGFVFADDNDNASFDQNEKGIAGATVELYMMRDGEYTLLRSTETLSDGSYKFDALDINERYAVKEIQPTGWNDGQDSVGTLGGILNVTDDLRDIDVAWDQHGLNYNFGELRPAVPGGLSGYVYYDANKNGTMDETESGIGSVSIILWKWNPENQEYEKTGRETTTNSEGYYRFFNLEPNQMYRVTEIQPTEYLDGTTTVGSLDGAAAANDLFDINVGSGEYGVYYNFGEILEITTPEDPTPGNDYGTYQSMKTLLPPNNYYGGSSTTFNYNFDSPSPSPHTVNFFGGGGLPATYSWHLSVLNGGYPRSIEALNSTAGYRGYLNPNQYQNVSFSNESLTGGEWLVRGNDGSVSARYVFGAEGASPITGDWNGDGRDSIGIFVKGQWYMDRNGDGVWDADDLWAELGNKTDQAVTGDWDGDGKSDIGIFGPQWAGDFLSIASEPGLPTDFNEYVNVSRPKNMPPEFNASTPGHRTMVHRNNGQLRLDLIDHVFEYGNEGDVAVSGDWNGDGVSKIGVYRKGKWFLDVNGNGQWDHGDVYVENFGNEAGLPVVGDFNGDGIDEIGLFHQGNWSIDTDGDYRADNYFTFGQAGDQPTAGDFNGDGMDEFAVYRPNSSSQQGTAEK